MSSIPPGRRHAALAGVMLGLLGSAMVLPAPAASASAQASGARALGAAGGQARDDRVVFKVSDPRIAENSGMAASRKHPGVVYTHNDSGGAAQVYALGQDGRTRAVLTLSGAHARDWEGIALGADERGRPAIYAADIGDNMGGAWPYVTVYRIPEPDNLRSQTLRATAFRFKYADGPRNAETVMINPKTNRLYIASKLFSGALYEAPRRLRTSGFNTLRRVGDAPPMATDGAFAPDGSSYVIRTYFGSRVYSVKADGSPGKSLRSVSLPAQEQGESVTYTPDGRSLLVGSEGLDQPVYEVPLPSGARPSASSSPAGAKGRDNADQGHRDATDARAGLFLALAIAALVGYGVLRRRA